MDDIANESELSKGTLYLYFKNKEELAFTIIYENIELIKKMIEKAAGYKETGIQKIKRIARIIPDFYDAHTDFFDFTGNLDYNFSSTPEPDSVGAKCAEMVEKIIAIFVTVLKEGVKDGSMRGGINVEKTAILYANIVTSLLQRLSVMGKIFNQQRKYEPRELIKQMLSFMIHSLQ
jgi:AcrR family transcriptional regulator